MPTLSWKQGTWDSASALYLLSDSLFSFSWKKRPLLFRPLFQARPQLFAALKERNKKASSTCLTTNCGAGNADGLGETSPAPSATIVSLLWKLPTTTTRCARRLAGERLARERIAQRPPNMWRYSELLPLPQGYEPRLPVGFTPLLQAPRLAEQLSGTTAAAEISTSRTMRSACLR